MPFFYPALVTVMMAAPAVALQPSFGCYGRVYDEDHLATAPRQSVREIYLDIRPDNWVSVPVASLRVVFADQGVSGQNVISGAIYGEDLFCTPRDSWFEDWMPPENAVLCTALGDAAVIAVEFDRPDEILVTAGTVPVPRGPWPSPDRAPALRTEGGVSVKYRLSRVPEDVCLRMR